MLFLKRLFGMPPIPDEAARLYAALAGQARNTEFYARLGVPDSIDGRFEMLCVHAHAVFHRLRGHGERAEQLAQAVYDAMFADLDGCLREIGAADIGVGRRIKIMTEALKGRIHAYDSALAATPAESEAALRAAISRNAYGTVTANAEQLAVMARYLRDLRSALASSDLADLLSGRIRFPSPGALQDSEEGSDASR